MKKIIKINSFQLSFIFLFFLSLSSCLANKEVLKLLPDSSLEIEKDYPSIINDQSRLPTLDLNGCISNLNSPMISQLDMDKVIVGEKDKEMSYKYGMHLFSRTVSLFNPFSKSLELLLSTKYLAKNNMLSALYSSPKAVLSKHYELSDAWIKPPPCQDPSPSNVDTDGDEVPDTVDVDDNDGISDDEEGLSCPDFYTLDLSGFANSGEPKNISYFNENIGKVVNLTIIKVTINNGKVQESNGQGDLKLVPSDGKAGISIMEDNNLPFTVLVSFERGISEIFNCDLDAFTIDNFSNTNFIIDGNVKDDPILITTQTNGQLQFDANNAIEVQPDGSYTFDTDASFTGDVPPIGYTIKDPEGGMDNAILTITIEPDPNGDINNTYANDDSNAGPQDEEQTGNIKSNDNDPENQPTTIQGGTTSSGTNIIPGSEVDLPSGGKLTIYSNGDYEYQPAAGFVGTEVTTFTLCDDQVDQACKNAMLYLTTLAKNIPDYTPTITLVNAVIVGSNGNADMILSVQELEGIVANNKAVELRMTKVDQITLNYNPALQGDFYSPFTQVDNTVWTFDDSNTYYYKWIYNGASVFKANQVSKIGINANFNVDGAAEGTQGVTVTIPYSSVGGEVNINNNLDKSEIGYENQ